MLMPATNRYRRLWFYGTNTILTSLIFVAILVFVVMIVEKHPWRVDLTETGKYSPRSKLGRFWIPFRTGDHQVSSAPRTGRNPTRDLDTLCYYNKNVTYELSTGPASDTHKYEIRDYGTLSLKSSTLSFQRRMRKASSTPCSS
jgi:hypothetical protein